MELLHDSPSKEDLIGHLDIQITLVDLIKSLPKDAESSFSIGVYGEWGAGKTSMLEQIRVKLLEEQGFSIIWFNPWQFSGDDNIIHAFFQVLASQIQQNFEEPDSKDEKGQISTGLRRVATAIRTQTKSIGIPGIWTVDIQNYNKLNTLEDRHPEVSDLVEKLDSKSDVYFDMLNHLNKIFKNYDEKIIVFVDDLDRCSSNQAIRFLEGVKVLFDIPNFIFIMGMAHSRIERAIEYHFNNKVSEDDRNTRARYLDKIIQFSFNLPRPDPAKVKSNILKPNLKEIRDFEQYADLIIDTLGTNPRTIKRLLNTISFRAALANNRIEKKYQNLGLVLKSALIAFLMPELNVQLEKYPHDLIQLSSNALKCVESEINDILESITIGINPAVKSKIQNQEAVTLYKILICGGDTAGFSKKEQTYNYIRLSSYVVEIGDDITTTHSKKLQVNQIDKITDIIHRMVLIDYKNNFEIDPYLITQELYKVVMGKNPSTFQGNNYPVENVSWLEAVIFCNQLSEKVGLGLVYKMNEDLTNVLDISKNKNGFRLPTEDEWKIAFGEGYKASDNIENSAWYFKNAQATTQSVGQLLPNNNGIFDLLGNVWEWCEDASTEEENIGKRICKGGSWSNFESSLDIEKRLLRNHEVRDSNIGFRVVRTVLIGK